MDNKAKRNNNLSDVPKRKNLLGSVVVTRRREVKFHFFDDINNISISKLS